MSHVPLPVRVAVGLVVTAVEQARKLPEQLVDLPVTAASRAVQAGMRVQQRVTELAIKGDQVFSLLQPVEDSPPWARFDEDDEPPASGTEAGEGEPANAGDSVSAGSARSSARAGARPDTAEIDEADVAQALTPSHASTDGTRPAAGGPSELPAAYDEMSLAELRTKLRGLSLPQLEALLVYEHTHRDRPAFVTLLSNRISTVRAQ
ncbi:MAG: lipid droplet-associated protein [Pseudonocardiales bacterium]|nr:lipid droplet-associated protein [Pseudonocardiales bacterium]